MFKLVLEKAEGPDIKLLASVGNFCIIDYAKAFDCVDHKTVENFERYGNTRPAS